MSRDRRRSGHWNTQETWWQEIEGSSTAWPGRVLADRYLQCGLIRFGQLFLRPGSDMIGRTGIFSSWWSSHWAKRWNCLPFLSYQSCHCLINSPPDLLMPGLIRASHFRLRRCRLLSVPFSASCAHSGEGRTETCEAKRKHTPMALHAQAAFKKHLAFLCVP